MLAFTPCKINLGLHVVGKRWDGFHNIETCFYPIPWTDVVEVVESEKLTFTLSGLTLPGDPDDNLCLQAYRLLSSSYNVPPVYIHLHKCVPTGAGLGGGSSDAAATLCLLSEISGLNLQRESLRKAAAELGSDCAFFLQQQPMIGTGRGDVLSPSRVSLAGKYLVLLKPSFDISTAEAYSRIEPHPPAITLSELLEHSDISAWKDLIHNDFEDIIFDAHPALKLMKEELYAYGALYASMTGSGSAIYGIFLHRPVLSDVLRKNLRWEGLL